MSEIYWDLFHNCSSKKLNAISRQKKPLASKGLLILDSAPVHCHEELENAHSN